MTTMVAMIEIVMTNARAMMIMVKIMIKMRDDERRW